MYDGLISSNVCLRSRGSFPSFSFNDSHCYYLNERIERSSSLSSCACCAFSVHRVPINPIFLYGLRQSALISWSAYRKLIIGGSDRCFRLPIYDLDRVCYGVSCSVKEPSVDSNRWRRTRRRRKREGRFGCSAWEETSERFHSAVNEDAEAMLSLLSEVVDDNYGSVSRRKVGLQSGKVQVEKGGRVANECSKGEKENVLTDFLGRNSKGELESVTLNSKEEGYTRSEGRESSLRSENRRPRKNGSSCSSYYSFSSSGDIESDEDVQVQQQFSGESNSGNTKDFRRCEEGYHKREPVDRLKRDEDDVARYEEMLIQVNDKRGSHAMRGDVLWDSTNNAEKEISEQLVGKTRSRNKSSQNHSRISKIHYPDTELGSSSHDIFAVREMRSTRADNFEEETREQHYETSHQITEPSKPRRKSEQLTKISETQDFGFQMAPSSQKRIGDKEATESSILVPETSGRFVDVGCQSMGKNGSRKESQQLSEMSESHDIDVKMISNTKRLSKTTRTASTLKKQSQTRSKSEEEKFSSVLNLVPEMTEHRIKDDQAIIQRKEVSKDDGDLVDIPTSHPTDTRAVSISQGLFETKMSGWHRNSTSVVDLVKEVKERHNQTGEEVMEQHIIREESQRPIQRLSSRGSTLEKASISQESLNEVDQDTRKLIEEQDEDERRPQVIMMPPPSQLIARGSTGIEATSGYAKQEDFGGTSESGSSAFYTRSRRTPSASASHHKPDSGTGRDETYREPVELVFQEDTLGSVNRLEKSSTQFVGEFTEQLRHEASTTKIQENRTATEKILAHKDVKYIDSSQCAPEDLQMKEHSSRRSSAEPGAKGPADEMWDVADPSSQRTPGTVATEEGTSTTGGTIIRKTSRSLWRIIADIVLLRWAAHAETRNSAMRSGGRSSSNESVGSEAWFSGHEPEENEDENIKGGRRGMPKELSSAAQSQPGISLAQSQREASDATSFQEKIRQAEADTSFSSGTVGRDSPSKDTSSASREGHSVVGVESSVPFSARRLLSESSKVEVFRSGVTEQEEQHVTERLTDVTETKGKDGELKQRKLSRNKQVLKERFEEWEEAYKLESEQRRCDEMFMREALIEAKKAADSWEVPVGAVLVQHGKIIARGCNLVEELRDSTAHAEMVCIREASNLLRTWRLAETTLYVTLEPCPMCAGAILQARIDTVVWGAPNKLLGADGSWVKLFPGEGSSSDLANQAAGPIHPFHPKMTIRRGILAIECADVMQQFFQLRRKKVAKPESSTPASPLPISTHPSTFLSKMHNVFHVMFCL